MKSPPAAQTGFQRNDRWINYALANGHKRRTTRATLYRAMQIKRKAINYGDISSCFKDEPSREVSFFLIPSAPRSGDQTGNRWINNKPRDHHHRHLADEDFSWEMKIDKFIDPLCCLFCWATTSLEGEIVRAQTDRWLLFFFVAQLELLYVYILLGFHFLLARNLKEQKKKKKVKQERFRKG